MRETAKREMRKRLERTSEIGERERERERERRVTEKKRRG